MSSGFKKLGIQSERSRWPALAAKMSAVGLSVKENRTLTLKQKVDRWYVHSGDTECERYVANMKFFRMVNEGYRRM